MNTKSQKDKPVLPILISKIKSSSFTFGSKPKRNSLPEEGFLSKIDRVKQGLPQHLSPLREFSLFKPCKFPAEIKELQEEEDFSIEDLHKRRNLRSSSIIRCNSGPVTPVDRSFSPLPVKFLTLQHSPEKAQKLEIKCESHESKGTYEVDDQCSSPTQDCKLICSVFGFQEPLGALMFIKDFKGKLKDEIRFLNVFFVFFIFVFLKIQFFFRTMSKSITCWKDKQKISEDSTKYVGECGMIINLLKQICAKYPAESRYVSQWVQCLIEIVEITHADRKESLTILLGVVVFLRKRYVLNNSFFLFLEIIKNVLNLQNHNRIKHIKKTHNINSPTKKMQKAPV